MSTSCHASCICTGSSEVIGHTVHLDTHAAWKSSAVDESSQFHPKLCRNVDYLVLFQATINKVSAPVLGSGTLITSTLTLLSIHPLAAIVH